MINNKFKPKIKFYIRKFTNKIHINNNKNIKSSQTKVEKKNKNKIRSNSALKYLYLFLNLSEPHKLQVIYHFRVQAHNHCFSDNYFNLSSFCHQNI